MKRLVALLGFFVLCALGAWQVKRLHWKESILQKIKTPSRVHTSLSAPLKAFDRVRIRGTFLTQALHVIGRTHEGKGGYHVFVPFRTLDGEQVLVNVGWRPQRDFKEAGGVKTLEGYVRYGEKNWATPPHNPSKDEWGHGDPKAMGTFLKIGEKPFYLQALHKIGSAEPAPLRLRNKHLEYAVTWFLLAAVWLIIFLRRF